MRAGYAPRSAEMQASSLLLKDKVWIELERRLARYEVTADRVLAELARIAFANLLDYQDAIAQGSLAELTRDQAAGLVDWHQGKNGVRIKLDKLAALDRLGRYLKLFTGRVELDVSTDLAERIEQARRALVTVMPQPPALPPAAEAPPTSAAARPE